ncbi:MAG: ABC transporter ATP-binding protein/permease [Actinomycetia bacterium]|nr:ABC transporter ATP-binding protein/permease [Actinomycetes bacterium]
MKPDSSPLRRLWKYAANYRGEVIRASTWSFLNKAVDIAPPFLIGMAVDVVANGSGSLLGQLGIEDPKMQILVIALLTFVIWSLESLFEYLLSVGWRNLAQSIQHDLRIDTYEHLQELDVAYFEDRPSGDLMAVLNDDINQLERFLDIGANEVIQLATTVTLIGVAFFVIAPSIAWLAFLPVPVILWGSLRFQKKIEPRYAVVRDEAATINGQLANNIGGIATIKAFTAEDREVERVTVASDRYRQANASAIALSSTFTPLIRIAILVGFTATLVWGGFLAIDGQLNIGLYSVLVFLTQRLLWPLTRLGQTVDLYQRAMASTNRILDVLDAEPTIIDGTHKIVPESVEGTITFDDVTFSYDEGFEILRGINLEVEPFKTTAFVGATGSGKTTLIKLMLRFYDPDSGAVLLDDTKLTDLSQRDIRNAMALVSQDVFLFHGTVRENIAYGAPDATEDAVLDAARTAEAHDFIESLPNGYETIIGERGQKLSGGQRQRLSLARALLTDSSVLILDEATSAVDNETEAAIQRSLARISHGRTMVVIAHRLSTIRNADRIYVIDGGEVAEFGTHGELIGHDGIYRTLWNVQTGMAAYPTG